MSNPKYLTYDATHQFVACTLHQYALIPSTVLPHFNDHPDHRHDIRKREREAIQQELTTLQSSSKVKADYADFIVDDNVTIDVIPSLKLYRDSHQCNHCNTIKTGQTALKNMKAHLKEMHAITASKNTQDNWYKAHTSLVNSQRFFMAVPSQYLSLGVTRLFAVNTNTTDIRTPETIANAQRASTSPNTNVLANDTIKTTNQAHKPGETDTMAGLEGLQAQLKLATKWAKADHHERLDAVPETPSMHINPWLVHTRFLQILSTFSSWKAATAFMQVPKKEEEPELYFLYNTVQGMARTWQNTTVETSRHVRIAVMQEHPKDIPLYPLNVYQNLDLRHAVSIQKVFVFFARSLSRESTIQSSIQLTPKQQQTWTKIREYINTGTAEFPTVDSKHNRTELSKPERLCHEFWLSIVEQTTRADDTTLAILLPMAVLSLSQQGTGFREVYNFATDLSALKKFVRLAAIQLYQDSFANTTETTRSISTDFEEAVTYEEAEQIWEHEDAQEIHITTEMENRDLVDRFDQWIQNYLTTRYPTTMNWLITTARYASQFRYGENLDAFVHWSGDMVTIRSVRTSLSQFRNAVWNEYAITTRTIQQLCFANSIGDLPEIPWDILEEQATRSTAGYSAFNPSSPQLATQDQFISKQLLNALRNQTHKKYAVTDLNNLSQITAYSELVQEFLQHLLCLVHFTSGQPARGTEILSVQHENTVANGLRNIFLFNGLVAIVPRYHKGYNANKTLKTVYRFLPREVGSLLVWYLWLIRPFYTIIQHQLASSHQDRHYKLATSSFLWPDMDGDQHKTSRLLSKVITQATMRWMGQEINMSTMRHLLIAFGRRISNSDGKLQELSREEIDEIINEAEAEAMEMQAGHSPETAHEIYALDISQVFAKKQNMATAHFKTSCQWHAALGFKVDYSPSKLKETHSCLSHKVLSERINMDHTSLLRENFGPSARFRGQQKEALVAIMTGATTVAYIAGTGSGKSLLFQLPACFPNYGQSIVIAPLATLRADILNSCQTLKIRATVWKQGQCDETAAIILATPESLSQDSFIHMVQRLNSLGRLERIVVDEFHYVLQSHHAFRPHLRNLQTLSKYAIRVTLLSATIPHEEQENAYRLMGFSGAVDTFRESTVRTNVHYQVYHLSEADSTSVAALAKYIQAEQSKLTKILVYVETRSMAESLASALHCGSVHGGMDDSEKSKHQEQFQSTPAGILIATSAFSAGIHIPFLPAVFRVGKPDHIIAWMQESGRAGRDGSNCTARLLLSSWLSNTHFNKADPYTQSIVTSFVQDDRRYPTCRRQILDQYFDNESGRTMCRSTEATCDICEKRFYPGATPTPSRVAINYSPASEARSSYASIPQTPTPHSIANGLNTQTRTSASFATMTSESSGIISSSQIQSDTNDGRTNVSSSYTQFPSSATPNPNKRPLSSPSKVAVSTIARADKIQMRTKA